MQRVEPSGIFPGKLIANRIGMIALLPFKPLSGFGQHHPVLPAAGPVMHRRFHARGIVKRSDPDDADAASLFSAQIGHDRRTALAAKTPEQLISAIAHILIGRKFARQLQSVTTDQRNHCERGAR